jgi:hypothetical protein
MENFSHDGGKDTLAYIFKMNLKELFTNEITNLVEEIDSHGVGSCKVPILVNFIQYKLSELENHQKVAESLLLSQNSSNVTTKNEFTKFCKKENFNSIRNFMVEILIHKICEMDGVGLELIKFCIIPDSSKASSSQMKLYKIVEDKYKEINSKKEKDNTIKFNNLEKFQKNNIKNSDNRNNLANNQNNDTLNRNNLDNNTFTYKLKIYYLDGSDSYFQICNIKSRTALDYQSFIFNLKKKLGIYENARFKIVIMENKKEKEYFEDISQLISGEINEIKIVPAQYNLFKG